MTLSISATNPCHLFDLARELGRQGALSRYYSGYPRWKLHPPAGFPLVARSARTLVTYGCLRLPAPLRPAPHRLFRWQDEGFDAAVGRSLSGDSAHMLHAMPGQALATFRAARKRGIGTVLNHASGPVRQQLEVMADEYRLAGVEQRAHHGFDREYLAREDAEYALADRHCVASSVVRRQLLSAGIPPEKIWVVPYGADRARFHPPAANATRNPHEIVFAGQIGLRKGLRVAFDAIREVRKSVPVTLSLYGPVNADMRSTLASSAAEPWLRVCPPVSQDQLAEIFRRAAMLVLPSWEEAFGLVVVQALNCGLPCIVSDRVGAADLIEPHANGSTFPAGDHLALARDIEWWLQHPRDFAGGPIDWTGPARSLLELSAAWQRP